MDSTGHPIAGAQVFSRTDPLIRALAFDELTDDTGHFEWTDAPVNAVDFQFSAEGYITQMRRLWTAEDAVDDVVLRPAVDVQSVGIDSRTGEAIPRFRTQIGTHEAAANGLHWGPKMGRSAPKRFQIQLEAEKGPYQFEVSADGYLPARIFVPAERTIIRTAVPLEKVPK